MLGQVSLASRHNLSMLVLPRGRGGSLLKMFFQSEPDERFDESIGHGTIQRKLEVPPRTFVGDSIFPKLCISSYRREDSDMVFERSEVNQHPVQRERRHLIADPFFSVRGRFSDNSPDLLQDFLNRR